ncbi:hypothetical protein TSUD_364340 [Trifolium subterraneum]|uniref:Uncharacterized protein n=1 Tax=Trifolium subterraneum TaxID=3900 RepID=A0A2Z6MLK8_TRISU|nr:hypothetical protein TSUD_364340 [Trifolium subterraneum]
MLEHRLLLYSAIDDDGNHNYISDLLGKPTTGDATCARKVLLLCNQILEMALTWPCGSAGKSVHVSKSNDSFGV